MYSWAEYRYQAGSREVLYLGVLGYVHAGMLGDLQIYWLTRHKVLPTGRRCQTKPECMAARQGCVRAAADS